MKIEISTKEYTWDNVPDGVYEIRSNDPFYAKRHRIALVQTTSHLTKDRKQKRVTLIQDDCNPPTLLWPASHPEDWVYIPVKGKWTIEIES